jgi:hypothetical protein
MEMDFTNQCILIAFGLALLLLFGAMLWNIYRPESWRAEWRQVTRANAERADQQRIDKRLEQVAR